jgi:hypothetical protein
MGATAGISNAFWGSIQRFSRSFRNAIYSFHAAKEQLIHTTARGFIDVCENSSAFCKR